MITSLQNPNVKFVQKLRKRRHRDQAQKLLIEGYRAVFSAVQFQHPIERCFVCPELFLGSNEQALIDRMQSVGVDVVQTNASVFQKMAYRDRPDGLLAVGQYLDTNPEKLMFDANAIIVVVQSVEKPGNLGTILRSADGCGATGVLVVDPVTDIHNPNVVRASIGTMFSIPIAVTDSVSALEMLKQRGCQIVAAIPEAPQTYWQLDYSKPTAIVVGAEQYGLSDEWRQSDLAQVSIPMSGSADSLNVATATTLLLYEVRRQRTTMPSD